jgi:LTXXQ motif family protein
MRKIGAYIAITALAAFAAFGAVTFPASPAAAFGLRIGPFSIHVPFYIPRYYHPYGHANPSDAGHPESAKAISSPLLYPNLALPAILQNVFFPAEVAPWPFGYESIFSTAFARGGANGDPQLCQPSFDPNRIVGRIRDQVAPTADQMTSLQKLGGALGAAGGYLSKACPDEIPAQPVARLQLMESQIEELAMALDIVRRPLQDFEQSLSSDQLAKLAPPAAPAAAAADPATTGSTASSCGGSPAAIDSSIDQIDKTVQPTDAQQPALAGMRDAFGKAVGDLQAHCPTTLASTALGRLEAIEARLDATWRSELAIQVALANFETKLSDEQKKSFDEMNFAAAQ